MAKTGRPQTSLEAKRIMGTYRADRHGKGPKKARKPAAKAHSSAELVEMWSEVFTFGNSHFDDTDPVFPNWHRADPASIKAARSAWKKLGARFMTVVWPEMRSSTDRTVPWALEQFGDPS